MQAFCLNFPNEPHHLDHLCALADVLQLPVCCLTEREYALCREYYPFVAAIFLDDWCEQLPRFCKEYQIVFHSVMGFRQPDGTLCIEDHETYREVVLKDLFSVYCPHGNSDKGFAGYLHETLINETMTLVYGARLLELFRYKGILSRIPKIVETGNYRYAIYRKHQAWFDQKVQQEVLQRFAKPQPTLLYAPTWSLGPESSSFQLAAHHLLQALPEGYNLIVKLHPDLVTYDPAGAALFREEHGARPNVAILETFPSIYPLLQQAEAYIGDLSSVGYDFLPFNRPMFFINATKRSVESDPGLHLYRCGVEVGLHETDEVFKIMQKHLQHSQEALMQQRRETYAQAFGAELSLESLRERIWAACRGALHGAR